MLKKLLVTTILCSGLALSGCQTTGSASPKMAYKETRSGINGALETAAKAAQDQGAQKESLLFYEELYRRNPGDAKAVVQYAEALRHNNQSKKAEIILEPWAAKEQNAALEYARVLLSLGRLYEAETAVDGVLAKDSQNAQAHHIKGIALDAKGLSAEAEVHFRKALDTWQGSPVAVLNNLALNLAAQHKKGEAIAMLDRAMIYAPNESYLMKNRNLILGLSGGSAPVAAQKAEIETTPAPVQKPQKS